MQARRHKPKGTQRRLQRLLMCCRLQPSLARCLCFVSNGNHCIARGAVMNQVRQPPIIYAILAVSILTTASPAYPANTLKSIQLPGERAFPESITATPDGTLYVSSLASGGIMRIKPGASTAEPGSSPALSAADPHLAFSPMRAPISFGSVRMTCRTWGFQGLAPPRAAI
jgi:hypothetical protein